MHMNVPVRRRMRLELRLVKITEVAELARHQSRHVVGVWPTDRFGSRDHDELVQAANAVLSTLPDFVDRYIVFF